MLIVSQGSPVDVRRCFGGQTAGRAVAVMPEHRVTLIGDQLLDTGDWIAAWEGWPYAAQGLEASICNWLDTGVSAIHGQFNLAVFDRRTGSLHLLRDLAGSYSFYIASSQAGVVAASRIHWLERLLDRSLALSLSRLRAVHCDYAMTPPRSLFAGAELIQADRTLSFHADGTRHSRRNPHWIRRFQQLFREEPSSVKGLDSVVAALGNSLQQATAERSARFMLSGGLDSNLLLHAHCSSRVAPGLQPRGTTFGFPGQECDETPETSLSAKRADVDLEVVDLSDRSFGDYRDEQCQRCDVLPHVSTYFVTEAAERCRAAGDDTLISGLGGDEVFAVAIRRALALHVRAAPWAALRFMRRSPMVYWRGLARRFLSGSDATLRMSIEQSNAMFYMAAAQETERFGVALRSPFRDAAVLTAALAAACQHVLQGNEPRQFQRELLDRYQPGLSDRIGRGKAQFNDVVRAEPIVCEELGEPATPTIAAVTPAFLRVKRADGVPIEP